jgi:hypothetical protein
MPLKRLPFPSPNYSSRGGATVTTIVLHTAEGARTIQSLGSFFANPASGVSSHVGIDDTPGTVGEFVQRGSKAWTAANANGWAVQAELCAFAAWDAAEWSRHPNMLASCAAWIAEEAAAFGIPIVALSAAQAQDPNARGVCQHADLGKMGGGHVDCGPAFPFAQVLAMAQGQPGPSPQPDPITGEQMISTDPDTGGTWVVASKEGAVFTYDGAPYIGATNNTVMNAGKYPCVGLDTWKDPQGRTGLVMVLDWGDRGDGSGKSADGGDRFRRYRFPRDGSGMAKAGTTY